MANTKVTSNVIADNAVGITQLNVSDGSDGQALVTNGAGTLSFATVGVSGISSSADATAITIDSSERVGIKKTPTKELDVAGTIKAVGATNNNTMEVFGAETNNQSFGLLVNAGTSSSDYSALFRDENANTVLKIQGDSNIGIGTASPVSQLHLAGGNTGFVASNGAGIVGIQVSRTTSVGENLYMYTSSGTGWSGASYVGRIESYGNNVMEIGTQQNAPVTIGTNNAERMRFHGSGNVSIGTTSDSNALVVSKASDISMSAGCNGQFRVEGNGYSFAIALNGSGVHMYQNSTGRDLIWGNNETEQMRLKVSGYLGIGTSSPANLLTVGSSSFAGYPYRHQNGTGSYYMGHGNSSYHHHEQSGASVGFYWGSACYASGGFSTYSDERLKENITTIDGALDKVALMNGVSFTWIDTEKRGEGKQFGVTAQNMLEVDAELPKLVEDADATQEDIDNEEIDTQYYSMDYGRLTPFFIEAIKELKTKLEAAEARITELEG